jgi:hypothetical protein
MPVTINGTTGVDTPGVVSSGAVSGTTGTFSGNVTANGVATELRPLVLMTAQNSTSGTNIDFTGIPSWVKRVTLMFEGVSTSGNQSPFIQLGTSGGVVVTGYNSRTVFIQSSSVGTQAAIATGFPLVAQATTAVRYGSIVFTNFGSNTWVASGVVIILSNMVETVGGSVQLGGVLDRIRVSAGSTDTFDAGSINVMYE